MNPVTLVTHKPPHTGFGRFAAGLASALWTAGQTDATLIELDATGHRIHIHTASGTETKAGGPRAFHPFLFYAQAWRSLDIDGPVHVTNQHLSRLAGSGDLVSVHDLFYAHSGPVARRVAGRFLYRGICRAAGAFVSCRNQQEELHRHFPAAPCMVAPPGIDALAPGPGPDERHDLLHVGSAAARKNLPAALATLTRLPDHVRLVQVGIGPGRDQDRLRAVARSLGVDHRVDWRGLVPESELRDAYRRARVLLFPSLYEGFGYPVFEAMSAGTPVVAVDIPTLRDLAHPAATLVRNDPDALAAGCLGLLGDDDAWHEASTRSQVHATRFSWDNVVGDVLRGYEQTFN